MARQEQDREDLLREAVALVERIELRCGGFSEPVVIGFRRTGDGSIFIGGDLVFQFNSRLELRRGFADGKLLKAEHGKLVSLERHRTAEEVQLLRTELSPDESANFLSRLVATVAALQKSLNAKDYEIIGQVPADQNVLDKVTVWLASLPENPSVAKIPNVR